MHTKGCKNDVVHKKVKTVKSPKFNLNKILLSSKKSINKHLFMHPMKYVMLRIIIEVEIIVCESFFMYCNYILIVKFELGQ